MLNFVVNPTYRIPRRPEYLGFYFCSSDVGTNDDYIGTIYLPVSQLSGQAGKGETGNSVNFRCIHVHL